MEDWKHMFYFADESMMYALNHTVGNDEIEERLAIVTFDHATELFMKAYLLREGYLINKINDGKIKNNGIKKDSKIANFLEPDKTIGFYEALNLVIKVLKSKNKNGENLKFSNDDKRKIEKFHRLRNEIQHRAKGVPLDKTEQIREFYPSYKVLITAMFPNDSFPDL